MKRIHIALIAIVVFLSACSKEQIGSGYQSINVSELSTTVTEYVAENYPDASIVSASKASNTEATYLLTLNTNEELAFDASGNCLGEAGAVLSRGNNNRHNHHGGPGHNGGGPGNGGGPHGHGMIPVDSLPTTITSYISLNYPSDTILGARLDTTCQFGNTIQVMVTHTGVAPTKLAFDLSGTFLFSAQRTLYSATPQAVKDTLTSVYNVGANVRNKVEVLTLANSSVEYNVFLRVNKAPLMVTIQDNGTIVCTK